MPYGIVKRAHDNGKNRSDMSHIWQRSIFHDRFTNRLKKQITSNVPQISKLPYDNMLLVKFSGCNLAGLCMHTPQFVLQGVEYQGRRYKLGVEFKTDFFCYRCDSDDLDGCYWVLLLILCSLTYNGSIYTSIVIIVQCKAGTIH